MIRRTVAATQQVSAAGNGQEALALVPSHSN
jgi:hypothetical protein